MSGVEQAQLHVLIGSDIVDELDSGFFVGRPTGGESVLEHPLEEGFGHDRPGVDDAGVRAQFGPIVVGRGRGDAVDHRVRECHVGIHPLGQPLIDEAGEGGEHLLRDPAVMGDVVARLHGERLDALLPAVPQRRDDIAEDRGRCRTRSQGRDVGDDDRVVADELAGDGVDVVAALGDGEGDEANGRVREQSEQSLRIVGPEAVVDDRADHPPLLHPIGVFESQCVQVVLCGQGIAHDRVVGEDAGADDPPVPGETGPQQIVDDHRHMRPVETADTEVDDPRGHRRPVVVGNADAALGQRRQILRVQRQPVFPFVRCHGVSFSRWWVCDGRASAPGRAGIGSGSALI